MINAILVDDHELFRLGVKTVMKSYHPDICIAGEAETGADFFALLEKTTADIVLLDINLPDMSGIEIARYLKKNKPEMKILVISSENTSAAIQAMLSIGIDGFISKRMGSVNALADAIRSVMDGLEYYGKDISEVIYQIFVAKKKTIGVVPEFTKSELTIIDFCRKGLQSKEIANQLNISPRTVESHKNNIFHKLGINNTVEMLQYAMNNGIIKFD